MTLHNDSIRSTSVRVVDTHAPRQASEGPAEGPPARRGSASRPIYRPLIIGPAILYRVADTQPHASPPQRPERRPWQVDLVAGSRLRPVAPRSLVGIERVEAWRRRAGCDARVGAALISCCDIRSTTAEGAMDQPAPPQSGACEDGRSEAASGQLPPASRFRFADTRRGGAVEIYGWALMYQLPGMVDRALIDPHDELDSLPAFYESPLELVDRSAFLASRGIPSRPIALLTRPDDFVSAGVGGAPLTNVHFPRARFRRPADLSRIF